jgi:dihydrofolate synthase/folylpolyglutamate synthase
VTYREALAWLFGTQLFGIKLGLDNIQRLLTALRVPAPEQRVIHVAGTNGKGSVCAMIDSISRAADYSTGLFTSPHLVSFRERIQVNGEMIGENEVARGLTSIRDLVRDWDPHPTFFEIATALALLHFREARCEILVLETGMGGRLDATNAVTPVVSVLTPIDFDHQKWLGSTLEEIAAEKAGIIKLGVPVVSAAQLPAAEAIVRRTAAERGAPLEIVLDGYDASPIGLTGAHQSRNAALALAALRAAEISLTPAAVQEGLTLVQWPARFQRWDERITLDGAHNPAGAQALAQTWRETFGDERAAIVLAVLNDKDAAALIAPLAPLASHFILPRVRTARALPPAELAALIRVAAPAAAIAVVPDLAAALVALTNEPRVLITGSLHFAGEVLAWLRGEPDELEDCLQ